MRRPSLPALAMLVLLLAGCAAPVPPSDEPSPGTRASPTGGNPGTPGTPDTPSASGTPGSATARLAFVEAYALREGSAPAASEIHVALRVDAGSIDPDGLRLAYGRGEQVASYGASGAPLDVRVSDADQDGMAETGDTLDVGFRPAEPLPPYSGFVVRVEADGAMPVEVVLQTPATFPEGERIPLGAPAGEGGQPAQPGSGSGAPGTTPPSPPSRFPGCSGTGKITFANAPMRMEDVESLLPYGLMVGAHVTPIDHMYFNPRHGSPRDAYEVRAIADGVIYEIGPRDVNVDTGESRAREWRMDIAHTCTFTSYFDLLTSLSPEIEAAYNATRAQAGRPWEGIPVKAGQVVGRIGAQTLDFGVYDYEVTLPGFIVPAHYEVESWKVHTVDPFPHFEADDRDAMLAKLLRTAEPRAGKIDHDVDGTAAGNWFVVGTDGYAGVRRDRYWDGHLALAPDFLDPTQLRFSTGNWSGDELQAGVVGNAPAWQEITVATGLVEIQVATFEHYAANDPQRSGFSPSGVRPGDEIRARNVGGPLGVVLLQLLEPRLLKVETFPGASPEAVTGFTSAAKLYER